MVPFHLAYRSSSIRDRPSRPSNLSFRAISPIFPTDFDRPMDRRDRNYAEECKGIVAVATSRYIVNPLWRHVTRKEHTLHVYLWSRTERLKNSFNVVACHVSVMCAIFFTPHSLSFIFTLTGAEREREWLKGYWLQKYQRCNDSYKKILTTLSKNCKNCLIIIRV